MPRFVADTMLGRLAHWLRAMGCDTAYLGPAEDSRLLELARGEDRLLITRDAALARLAGARGCLLRATDVDAQLDEVVGKLGLVTTNGHWLSRCLECNTMLERCDVADALEQVPERVAAVHTEFWRCPTCARIYWAGTHAERILARLGELRDRSRGASAGA